MQPITATFRPPSVVTGRSGKNSIVSSAVLVAALAATVWAGVHSESQGSASPAAVRPVGLTERVTLPAAMPKSSPPQTRHASVADPCTHNRRAQLIVVSIVHQHEWACAHHQTVLSTPVTTGATSRPGDATPRGTFAVQGLNRDTTLTTSAAGRYQVKYWIPFHLGVWGFHDASWQTMPFGSKAYVTRGSHGCVHMPLAAIRFLFHWVHYGTRVRIT